MLRFEKENGSIDFDVKSNNTMVRITTENRFCETQTSVHISDNEVAELIDFLQKRLGYRLNKKNK